ncbi:MAG: peptide chain release factor N(5)-glutamine methyltransferase [Anaerotruncus sp.]|nr:peptide chain release factor N(5)-glutamine methyltransferase [Anaerotruncus sp.]
MTLQQVYQASYSRLKPEDTQESSAALDLARMFEYAFGVSRYQLPQLGGQPADPQQLQEFLVLCARYDRGEPLQYLLGQWEFFGLPFQVGPGVLIPRPDTEILVETGLELIKDRHNPEVVDLCAGSGCVGISISSKRRDARVCALEKYPEAFAYLIENITLNRVLIDAFQEDVLFPPALPQLDLAISNPPYIPHAQLATLEIQVQYEPKLALDGGEDGLDFYRAISPLYLPMLKPGGALAFEVGYDQAPQVMELMTQAGYVDVTARRDLAGIQRVVYGFRPI